MWVNKRSTMFLRLSLSVVAVLCFAAVPVSAQQPCDLYVQVDEGLTQSSAGIDVAVQGTCFKPQTWAYARVTLPDGSYKNGSGSGTSYAEAFASTAINNQSGQAYFSGYGEAMDQCWEDSDSYLPFTDPFTIYNNTPLVTGIDPGNWAAGQTTNVTFSGEYFGTNAPSLSFSPSGGITYSLVSYNDTQIVANVNVSSGTPDEDVSVTVTNNGYGGLGFQSGGGAVSPNSVPATAQVYSVPSNTPRVTVIGWVNGLASDLANLPGGANAKLTSNLNSSFWCSVDVGIWLTGFAKDISTQYDRDYANAFMVKHSSNSAPPSNIDPNSVLTQSDFRLLNVYGGVGNSIAAVGKTPDPCGWLYAPVAGWLGEGQASQYNGRSDSSLSGKKYRVNEGRIGSTGRTASETINQGRKVPWVYSLIEFDSNAIATVSHHTTFPTFYVYFNGVRQDNLTSNQSTVKAFVTGYDDQNEHVWYPVP